MNKMESYNQRVSLATAELITHIHPKEKDLRATEPPSIHGQKYWFTPNIEHRRNHWQHIPASHK